MLKEGTKIRKTLNYLIRAAIILVTYGFIYRQVFLKQRPEEVLARIESLMAQEGTWVVLALVLFLMLINWGLESAKWQLLISKIEKVSFLRSYKAVLTGVSISLFTPNRTGDYLGRVFILEKGNHIEGIVATLIGSFAQLVITLSIGLFCLLSFIDQYLVVSYQLHEYLLTGMIFLVPLTVFILLLGFFKIGLLTDLFEKYVPGRWEKLIQYARILGRYNARELFLVLSLSLARYLIFCGQFLILLNVLGVTIPVLQGIILIPVIYLFMAVVPSIALADLGIRGSVSLFVLGLYFAKAGLSTNELNMAVITASTLIWLVNLILPAVLGTLFVFNLKFFRK